MKDLLPIVVLPSENVVPLRATDKAWPKVPCCGCDVMMCPANRCDRGVYSAGWVCDSCPEDTVELMSTTTPR
jgi:hypothetical protein